MAGKQDNKNRFSVLPIEGDDSSSDDSKPDKAASDNKSDQSDKHFTGEGWTKVTRKEQAREKSKRKAREQKRHENAPTDGQIQATEGPTQPTGGQIQAAGVLKQVTEGLRQPTGWPSQPTGRPRQPTGRSRQAPEGQRQAAGGSTQTYANVASSRNLAAHNDEYSYSHIDIVDLDCDDHYKALAMQGDENTEAGQFGTAIHIYSQCIMKEPSRSSTIQLLANRSFCYEKLGLFSKALADAEQVIRLSPHWAEGYCRKGRALDGLGMRAEALEAFSKMNIVLEEERRMKAREERRMELEEQKIIQLEKERRRIMQLEQEIRMRMKLDEEEKRKLEEERIKLEQKRRRMEFEKNRTIE